MRWFSRVLWGVSMADLNKMIRFGGSAMGPRFFWVRVGGRLQEVNSLQRGHSFKLTRCA
jgi:hypothetical protein